MPTPPRIAYPGAYYHVISRGNNKSKLFLDNADRIQYLSILHSCSVHFHLKIYAYVLMSNHIHLFFKTSKANISETMHRINLDYTTCFNKRHEKTGHLFESRFKSKLVQKDRYFLAVLRYIHLNPVKAGIVSTPEDYRWSSHCGYISGGDKIISNTRETFNYFGRDKKKAKEAYKEFINLPVSSKEWDILNKVRNGILGDFSFRNSKR